jgi:hypothetical protein
MYAFRGALVCALCFLAVASLASADVNPTPIAVPLIGDQGVGSPYPSRIHLVSRAVTHPCPEELAVLPMRTNGTIVNKYLLMSHAGSCRPLQGTDLVFQHGATPIPDTSPPEFQYSAFSTTIGWKLRTWMSALNTPEQRRRFIGTDVEATGGQQRGHPHSAVRVRQP